MNYADIDYKLNRKLTRKSRVVFMDKEQFFQKLYDLGVSEESALMYAKLVSNGVSVCDALEYAEWLRKDDEKHNPVQFAYLCGNGTELSFSLSLDINRLGCLWGLWIDGTFWCRWHADTLTFTELQDWLTDGRSLKKLSHHVGGLREYEHLRIDYFYQCAGSDLLNYSIPSVDDYQAMMPHIEESSLFLKTLGKSGCCIHDWYFHEDYWAFDTDKQELVVFDINNGVIKPWKKNERYAWRPISVPRKVSAEWCKIADKKSDTL